MKIVFIFIVFLQEIRSELRFSRTPSINALDKGSEASFNLRRKMRHLNGLDKPAIRNRIGKDLDRKGLDRKRLDSKGLDRKGLDRKGLDKKGLDRKRLDRKKLASGRTIASPYASRQKIKDFAWI